jgi:hypothetical protein
MDSEACFKAFVGHDERVDLNDLFALFDSLDPIVPDAMFGDWDGGVFDTGHPGEQQLGLLGWAGKTFRSQDDVDPIVSKDATGARRPNPILGQAMLRAVAYRGVVTATMIYDQYPILDHFRRIADDLVLGVMDRKGEEMPLFFWLRRRAN